MSAKTIAANDVLDELDRIRLEEDLTYSALGKLVGMPGQTVQHLLKERPERPYDRTIHKIKRYLASRQSTRRSTRSSHAQA